MTSIYIHQLLARKAQRLWHSHTVTTWGSLSVQSLRLLALTPLILIQFNETEIAAWYLFATLNVFGVIMTQRIGLTFNRIFAFAMAGSTSLEPIKKIHLKNELGESNWPAFEKAFGTIGSINLGVGWINVGLAAVMGWIGLGNIVQGYDEKSIIWIAFAIMQITTLISFTFQHFQIALQGMNYIALVNRWNILWGALSCLAGCITLWAGGGIVSLVIIMQLFTLISVANTWFLLRKVEEGRVAKFKVFAFDLTIFKWAWEPTWKGFLGQLGILGSTQFAAITYTAFGAKADVASFLFAQRILQIVVQMGQAPFSSLQPFMSKLLASGEYLQLGTIARKRISLSLGLTAVGFIFCGLAAPFIMDLVGSNIKFIPLPAWLLMTALTLIIRFDVMSAAVCGLGNHILFHIDLLAAALLTIGCTYLIKDTLGIYGPILTMSLPIIVILNKRPYTEVVTQFKNHFEIKWGLDFGIIYLFFLSISLLILAV